MISNHITCWFTECADACLIYELIPRELVIVNCTAASAKPGADIFEFFLKRLAAAHPGFVASDCIFVDDKDSNIEAAEKLGFRGLLFDASTAPAGELERKLAEL